MLYKSFNDYLGSMPPDTIFRIWQYKKRFTPYEEDQKFIDQSLFVDTLCTHVLIKDVIELPDGDLLLAVADAEYSDSYVSYYKLSEIVLAKSDKDMEDNNE